MKNIFAGLYMRKSSVWNEFPVVLWDCKFSLGWGRRVGEEERGGAQNGATIPVQFIGDYFKFGHRMT